MNRKRLQNTINSSNKYTFANLAFGMKLYMYIQNILLEVFFLFWVCKLQQMIILLKQQQQQRTAFINATQPY